MTGCRHRPTTAILALLGLGACVAAPPPAAPVPFARTVALPAPVAAALTADALRHALPFGDPLPASRGAPLSPQRDGGFAIAWVADGRGGLRPVGSHRLALLPPPAAAGASELQPTADCRGPAPAAAPLGLWVDPAGPDAAVVRGHLPADGAPALAAALDHALDLGTGVVSAGPGLATPSQCAWQAHRIAAALTSATPGAAAREPLLQRLLGLGAASPELHADLGDLAARAGRPPAATSHWWLAALGSDDPLRRQQCATAAFTAGANDSDSALHAAAVRAAAGDSAAALALLHTAQRLAGAPRAAIGYAAAAAVHAPAQPALAGLARSLLAREHGADPRTAGVASALADAGLGELANRVHGAAAPALAAPALAAPAR